MRNVSCKKEPVYNIEKLSEFHEGKEFAVDELEEVLSGKRPTKDKDGQIKFTEPVSIKNTKVATVSQDVTLNADNLESKKEALKSKWREFLAEAGDLGISFFVPVAGPPTGAAFSQVVKGERDDTKSLEGLAWGAADFTVAGLLKKVKTGGKLVSMVPKGVKLVEETKSLMKVKVEITDAGKAAYQYTNSAAKHINELNEFGKYAGLSKRPFMKSTLFIEEITSTGKGIPDATAKGALNFKVPGSFRGSKGVWELVVDTEKKIIYHFNFKGG